MTKEELDKLQGMLVDDWKGYDLEELKYRRAIALARKEIQKEKTLIKVQQISSAPFSVNKIGGSLVKNIFGNATVTDYIVVGFRMMKNISRIIKHLRR